MIFDGLAKATGYDQVRAPDSGLRMYGLPTAGVHIDENSAMKFGAWFACIRVVSESLMILPWGVFEQQDDKRERAAGHPVDQLLRRQPNPEMPAYAFKQTGMAHALSQGNFYAEVERQRSGTPVALWPLNPRMTTARRDSQNKLYYENRSQTGKVAELLADDVFHVRGPSLDGLVGLSVVACAREAISAGRAAEQFGAAFFGNGAMPGVLVSHKEGTKLERFTDEGLKSFYKSWKERLGGSAKANKMMYLDPGLEATKWTIEPEDAQFIETRKLSITEICRWFRVPPHKIADLEKATFSNIEQQSKEFVEDAILPWVKRFEEEANLKLLDGDYYSRFSVQALLRGDSQARAEYYQKLMDRGVLTINNVLQKEDMNGIGPEGDVRMVPMNMTSLDRLGKDKPGSGNESTVGS